MQKIEAGHPIPDNIHPGMKGGPRKYPFYDMEVGDSFAVDDVVTCAAVRNASNACGSRTGMKFSTRKVGDAWRCWRVA